MVKIDKTFDLVVALDILEHVEQPSLVFDKLLSLANVSLVISLPNCYDFKNRIKFIFKGYLGGKYDFKSEVLEDRHRWIMSRPEIQKFYADKAMQHHIINSSFVDMKYGDPSGNFISKVRAASRILPDNLCIETVFGVFTKKASIKSK